MALTIRTDIDFDRLLMGIQETHSIKTASGAIKYAVQKHKILNDIICDFENKVSDLEKENMRYFLLIARIHKLEESRQELLNELTKECV